MNQNLYSVGERLRDIVEILNDIIDLESHVALILEDQEKIPTKFWHYLKSFEEVPPDWLQKLENPAHPFHIVIRDSVTLSDPGDSEVPLNQAAQDHPHNESLWIPLVLNQETIGALSITYGRSTFPHYYQWLCENTVRMSMKSLWDQDTRELWENLRFGILHRKGFFSTQPTIDETVSEYLDRAADLFPKDNVWANIRSVATESSVPIARSAELKTAQGGSFRHWLTFRSKRNIEEADWIGLQNVVKELRKEDIDYWLHDINNKFGNTMQDPDDRYSGYFRSPKSKSHVVIPSIFHDQLVGLFTFDSEMDDAFGADQIAAVAILAAHAAQAIANAQSRAKKEEQRKWFEIFHELRVSLSTQQLSVEETFNKCVESIKGLCNATGANMFLFPSAQDPSLSMAQNPLLKASTFGSDFNQKIYPRSDGLTFQVLKERRPFWVNNPDDPPGINPVTAQEGVKAYLCLPMKVQDSIVGVLFVHYPQPHVFTENEMEMLTLFADEVSAAVENRRLMKSLEGIALAAKRLSNIFDFESAMQIIAETARDITWADSSSIFLWDTKTRSFALIARCPPHGSPPVELPRVQGGLTQQILDTGNPIKIDDATKDDRVRKAVIDDGTRSLIGVCLQMGDEKIGALYIDGERVGQFREYDLRILQTLANQASLVLGSRRRLLKPSMEIEESSSHLFRLEPILVEVCKEVKDRFKFEFVAIQMIRHEERIIETVHGTGISEKLTGLSKHYLEEDPELRDIQADIALSDPPRIEIIRGRDNRFNEYLYRKFKHSELVRAFLPMIVVRDTNGEIVHSYHQYWGWRETQKSHDIDGWRRVLEAQLKSPPGNRNEIDYEIIGTVEVGYQNPQTQITNAQVEELSRYIAQETPKIYRASSLSYLLETFTKQAMEVIGADSASTHFLFDKERSRYLYECCAGNISPRFLKDHPPRKNGLGQQALRTRQPVFVPNRSRGDGELALKSLNPEIFRERIKAMAAFPLLVDEWRQGVLYIHFKHPHRFTEDEINWVQILSKRAVDGISRGITHTQMRDRTRQMNTLNRMAQYLAKITPGGDLLEEIAWNSLQIFGADVVTIYEYIEPEDRFVIPPKIAGRLKAQSQMNTEIIDHNAPVSLLKNNDNLYAERSREDKIMNDPEHRRPTDTAPPFVVREKIKSSAGIILRVGEQKVGAMFINYRRPKNWSQEERAVIETVASFAAIAIRNARLYKSSEEGRNKLALLRNIQTRLVEELDLRKDLDLILEEAKTLFHADSGHIRLYDRRKGKLTIMTGVGDYHSIAKKEVGAGESVSGRLIKDPSPIIVAEVQKSEFFSQKELEEAKAINPRLYVFRLREKSFACLPLVDSQELAGTLCLSSTAKNTFTEAHRNSLADYCKMAMVAIRNAKVHTDTLHRFIMIERLHEVSFMMQEDYSLEKKIAIILAAITVRGGLEFSGAALFIKNNERNTLTCQYSIGPCNEQEAKKIYENPIWEELALRHKDDLLHELDKQFPLDKSLGGFSNLVKEMQVSLADSSQSLVKAFYGKEVLKKDVSEITETDILRDIKVKEFVLVPLVIGEKVIGVLYADNRYNSRPIGGFETLLLKFFADQAAMVLENELLIDQLKGQFRYLVHATTTPLVSIGLLTEQLYSQRDPDRIEPSYRTIKAAIADLHTNLKNYLAMSRYEQNMLQPDLQPLNLGQLVGDTIDLFALEAADKGISLQKQVTGELIGTRADPSMISQALHNLVKNALYAFPESHRGNRVVEISLKKGIDNVVVVVRDTGVGIKKEEVSRIFDPYYTGNKRTGIGLTISLAIAKLHGGNLTVESQIGEGSTFYLTLPIMGK